MKARSLKNLEKRYIKNLEKLIDSVENLNNEINLARVRDLIDAAEEMQQVAHSSLEKLKEIESCLR